MRIGSIVSSVTLCGIIVAIGAEGNAAGTRAAIPIACSHGPEDQKHHAVVTVPETAAPASVFKVRVDGVDSGKISHTGLNYIFDMSYEWMIPPGTELVAGSLRIVPNTGSPNVRAGARIAHKGNAVQMMLPAHVEDGSHYTPPSFEFDLKVQAAAGATISQKFKSYRVMANAFLVGNVETTCDPKPKPFPVGKTRIEKPADPPAAPAPAP